MTQLSDRNKENMKFEKSCSETSLRYKRFDDRVILLLVGGTKKGQQKDIDKAKEYWQDYRAREL